jgi:phage baseplate assembly protein W
VKDLFLISVPNFPSPVAADDNDVLFKNGDFVAVEGQERKFQDVIKILETAIGSNPVFTTYGSALPTVPGTEDISVNDKIRESVIAAIAFLVETETSHELSERISGIRLLNIKTDADGVTKVVRLVVALQNGQNIEFAKRL